MTACADLQAGSRLTHWLRARCEARHVGCPPPFAPAATSASFRQRGKSRRAERQSVQS